MTSSSSEEGRKDYRPRDYGLTSASAAAVLGISIYMLAKPAPDVIGGTMWQRQQRSQGVLYCSDQW